ncbi:MAG: response regulator [Halofilum sp. (in: g-proteobacteria)]|nr:response regulator [Halofilum sp. (in: g-proteobacteria)]
MTPPIDDLGREGVSIVLFDDSHTGRLYFLRALEHSGFHDVRIAESGAEVLTLLTERPADVVIADWLSPTASSLDMTHQIRNLDEENDRYTAIILTTMREGLASLVDALRQGVNDFLHKPFAEEELVARVFAAASYARAQNMLFQTGRSLARERHARAESWSTDSVTGLGSPDFFEAQLTTHLMEVSMRGGAVCCMLIEVEGPGRDNTPDEEDALQRIGRRLVRAVRPMDAVCRLEGWRFGLVMSAPTAEGMREAVMARVEREVSGRPLPGGMNDMSLALHMGHTVWEGPATPLAPSDLVRRAERSLEKNRAQA